MHGLGNDFVVLNGLERDVNLDREQLRRLADRRRGIGCDQVLLIRPPRRAQADFLYTIFNADGGAAEHCGNGIRCVARFLRDQGLASGDQLTAETSAGLVSIHFEEGELIRVNMGRPSFTPADIPLAVDEEQPLYPLDLDGARLAVAALSLGNPHAVAFVDVLDGFPVAELGAQVQRCAMFPRGVNVGFAQRLDDSRIKLRVFERGVGETPACGSGACAAVVVGITRHDLEQDVEVSLPGGNLAVSWAGTGEPVWMTGPAAMVYRGQIEL